MLNKVLKYIKENDLIEKKDRVLVALSGGPDSACLLHILYSLKDELNIEIGAAHVNHLLRGEEADNDEKYIGDLCEKLGIDYYVRRIDINEVAKKENISVEMAGREERYKFFYEIQKSKNYSKIAVAHNANDQAETILMRMMRGTGLEGLTGIKAKRDANIIRPILCLTRDEIENYCDREKLKPRIDKTNFEREYSRNKVRLDILPYMKENFNLEIVDALNRMASILQKDNDYIESMAKEAYEKYCVHIEEGMLIKKNLFNMEHESIVTRVIKDVFKEVSNNYQNFEMKHIYEIINLSNKETGKKISLTNKVIGENLYGDIILKNKFANNKEKLNAENIEIIKENIPCEVKFQCFDIKLEVLNKKNNIEFSNNTLIKLFDYDKIKERINIRNRKNGDKIQPLGLKGSKKVKDIFIDLKIPREERDNIPVVCFDDEISWLVNCKISEKFKITNSTEKILKVTFSKRGK